MGIGIVSFQRERLVKAVDRLGVPSQSRQDRAAIIMRFGKFRFLLQRLVEAGECFLPALERMQDHAVVDQDLWRGLAHAHCLRDQPQRLGRLAFRKLDDAEHLQRVEMVGPMGKHLGINALRLVQLALGMERERLRESLRYLERLALWHRRRRHANPLALRGKKAPLSCLGRIIIALKG